MTISEEVSKKGFIKHIGGIEFKNISENNFEFQSKVQDFNLNSAGIPHGGYIAAIPKKTKSLVFVKADLFQSENIIASASGIWKILK